MDSPRPAASIDLDDLNDAHSLAVYEAATRQRILYIGTKVHAAAEALQRRGCQVCAIAGDEATAAAARPYCEDLALADVERLDFATVFPGTTFDAVVLIEVLERAGDPVHLLRSAAGRLSADGEIIAVLPNVTHADVRLGLLGGRFLPAEVTADGSSPRRVFDRSSAAALFAVAGIQVGAWLRVTREAGETSRGIEPSAFASAVLAAATADADARTFQYVVVGTPLLTGGAARDRLALTERLQARLSDIEHAEKTQEERIVSLTAALARAERELRQREGQSPAPTGEPATTEAVPTDLTRLERENLVLRRTLSLRDEFLASLRAELNELKPTREEAAAKQRFIEELQRDIRGLNAGIAQFDAHVVQQDAQIAELQLQVDNRDRRITRLQAGRRGIDGLLTGVATRARRNLKQRAENALRPLPPLYAVTRRLYRRTRRFW